MAERFDFLIVGAGFAGSVLAERIAMESGFKAFKRDVLQRVTIEENHFGFEPKITAKVARLGVPIYDVAISYSGRTYAQGKKVNWRDGVSALRCIFKYNLGK